MPLLEEGYFLSARHLVKYPDCNATDNLFGGKMLAWIDEGAALYASCQMHTDRLVTLKMGEILFKVPVQRGKIVSIWCKTLREGTTSLTVELVATKRDNTHQTESEVIRTEMTFVAVDRDGNPTAWPKG